MYRFYSHTVHLECGATGNCAARISAAAARCLLVNVDQNLSEKLSAKDDPMFQRCT